MSEVTLRIEGGLAPRQHVLRLGERVVLGRGRSVSLPILDEEASRQHAAIELRAGGLIVTDLGSANGTFLDEVPLVANEERAASLGSTLRIGATRVVLGGRPTLSEDYERIAELGRGAYGVVFHARHRASGREVAIKALHAQVTDAKARERFLRESRVRIDAPQVAQIYDVRIERETVYLVMEFVRGQALSTLLQAGPLALPQVLHVGHEVACALAAAHAQGIVHRDVKPANVLVGAQSQIKLVDFGIAKEQGSVLTASNQGIGTLDYVAPEQAEDAKRVSPAADLYSLGATLYHALAGRVPFDSRQPDFFERLFNDDPTPLTKLRSDCPTPLARLVHRLLEKEPEDRPSDAAALRDQLARLRT